MADLTSVAIGGAIAIASSSATTFVGYVLGQRRWRHEHRAAAYRNFYVAANTANYHRRPGRDADLLRDLVTDLNQAEFEVKLYAPQHIRKLVDQTWMAVTASWTGDEKPAAEVNTALEQLRDAFAEDLGLHE